MAAVRAAVRADLDDLTPGELVLVACSGGPDSLALLAGLAWVAERAGLRSGCVHVDHGLAEGSALQARAVTETAHALGVEVVAAVVAPPAPRDAVGGPEALARDRRYAALEEAAGSHDAAVVLLGHTRDDQAESVLLGLARGSGARSLAGMPRARGRFRRPLLGLTRDTTVRACAALDLPVWADPANDDPAYARNRVRHTVLPALESALGPGVAAALARTADLLRDDADLLDQLADAAAVTCALPGEPDEKAAAHVVALEGLHPALRGRVLRRMALAAGCPAGALGAVHVAALDALITDWHGQGPAALPGGLVAVRSCARLAIVQGGGA